MLTTAPPLDFTSVATAELLRWPAETTIVCDLHWPHEGTGYVLAGDFGVPMDIGIAASVQLSLRGQFHCDLSVDADDRLHIVLREDRGTQPGCAVSAVLTDTGSPRRPEQSRLFEKIRPHLGPALEWKLAARLGADGDIPMLDCTFDFSAEGVKLYESLRGGDLSWLAGAYGEHAIVRGGRIIDAVQKETQLELHLPFLDRREFSLRDGLIAEALIEVSTTGRLVARTAGPAEEEAIVFRQAGLTLASSIWLRKTGGPAMFTLSHEECWAGQAAEVDYALGPLLDSYGMKRPVDSKEVSVCISVAGDAAAAWMRVPDEHGVEFFRAFSEVSMAVQRALRRWIPAKRLMGAKALADAETSIALMMYRASKPHVGRYRGEYGWDVIDPSTMKRVRSAGSGKLPSKLAAAARLLRASGQNEAAVQYTPDKARPLLRSAKVVRIIRGLLTAEGRIIETLVRFGAELSRWSEPHVRVRGRAEELAKLLQSPLLRLECPGLTSLLLVEATAALSAGLGHRYPTRAVVRAGGWTFSDDV